MATERDEQRTAGMPRYDAPLKAGGKSGPPPKIRTPEGKPIGKEKVPPDDISDRGPAEGERGGSV